MPLRVVAATLFYPRGGSAYVVRALAHGLVDAGAELTLVAGSRHDRGGLEDARQFYRGLMLEEVDFTAALRTDDPTAAAVGGPGRAPLQPSYEDRPDAPDRAFFRLGNTAYRRQVDAWADALETAGAAEADVLHLHHLTPLHEAAARVAPGVPIVTHIHGTELLMLEELADGPAAGHAHAAVWARRLRRWAASSAALVVAPGNTHRATTLLGVPPTQLATLANGYDPRVFRRRPVDRDALWRRVLVDEPRGWAPGGRPGDVAYGPEAIERIARGPVLLYVGRFTAVKRLQLLIEQFAAARAATGPASLVIVGGHPGEWEGEHPLETIERTGAPDVYLAGWHRQDELPELLSGADVLVLPSVRESFGQVLVEAMACGVPPVAARSLGPAAIVEDGDTGWLFAPDDAGALRAALEHALTDAAERERRAAVACADALDRFTWPALARRLERILAGAAGSLDAPERDLDGGPGAFDEVEPAGGGAAGADGLGAVPVRGGRLLGP